MEHVSERPKLSIRVWINTEENGRRVIQRKDIAAPVYKTGIFDFFENEFKAQLPMATNTRQVDAVGLSDETSAGGQQPPSAVIWNGFTGLGKKVESVMKTVLVVWFKLFKFVWN